jgi:hypothetical protein
MDGMGKNYLKNKYGCLNIIENMEEDEFFLRS